MLTYRCVEEYGDKFGHMFPKYQRLVRRKKRPRNIFGRSACDVALEVGVSIRTVQRWRAKQRASIRAGLGKAERPEVSAQSPTTISAKGTH